MGHHSRREIDPAGADRQDNHMRRLLRVRGEIENMALTHFTVKELASLLNVFSFWSRDISDTDLEHLESKVSQFKHNQTRNYQL